MKRAEFLGLVGCESYGYCHAPVQNILVRFSRSMGQTQSLALSYILPIAFFTRFPEVLTPFDHDQKYRGCRHCNETGTDVSVLDTELIYPGGGTAIPGQICKLPDVNFVTYA